MDTLYDAFVYNVNRRLDKLGETRAWLARELKCTASFITQSLNGTRIPSLTTIERFAEVLREKPHLMLRPQPPKKKSRRRT